MGLVDKFVPVGSVGEATNWLSRPPRSLNRSRSEAWKKYKVNRRQYGRTSEEALSALDVFQNFNRQLRNFSRETQCKHELGLIRRISSAPKLFHSYIRRRKKGRIPVGPLKESGGEVVGDARLMSEVLAESFSLVFRSDIPPEISEHQVAPTLMRQISVSYDEVLNQILKIDSSSSCGPDNMHPQMLKSCATEFAYPLSLLFSLSLNNSELPTEWKKSIVVPIFKGGSRNSPQNYRPVSLTSVCCKILERIITGKMMLYMEEHGILSKDQFGFRGGRSTEDQMLLTYGKICEVVDGGGAVDMVYMDYSKAFDVVSHEILLEKLRSLGFEDRIVSWVGDFLKDRVFEVSVGGCRSGGRVVLSGVPQGSVLGPLLFLVYVNHLTQGVSCSWKAFADDFKLYTFYSCDDFWDRSCALQRDLDSIVSVGNSWNLRVNPSKCVVMRFGSVLNRLGIDEPFYCIDGRALRVVDSYKDLGITVDKKLKFHAHIRTTVGKAGSLMNDLLRATVCRSPEFMVTLFVSHIRPILEFSSSVWNTGYLGDIRLLESLQRRWTRNVMGMENLEYGDRLRRLGLFSVYGRLLRIDLVNIWKSFHSDIDIGLDRLFEMAPHVGTRGHSYKLSIPVCRSELRRRWFAVRCVSIWNGLPAEVVESDSLFVFKKGVEKKLGNKLFEFF